MRNRMQDLDFEQTVAFDSVKDFEFTRKAAQKFRQVVSLDSFEDEDADVIFVGFPIWWYVAPHIINSFLEITYN